ncbi:pirin family protein [Segnochrobactrum spirostomi]|uniref:Pirin family protein n=1 Tax=Segnochrobactrum spirostomi TaxID=2608987 RepID=A0A6A7Y4K6_9HYPH|nr:pirin family protein [Segnochrobactrum spirostomi]MQT14074.1 pirin family protein [Segnochrobactrum spirostomi]
MSVPFADEPIAEPTFAPREGSPVETVILGRSRDLGGFAVRRALPAPGRRMVGPFIFLDQMGPADFAPGEGLDVRPHPHIGLATVTYLFEGSISHRDSLGSVKTIEPGAVNWMSAGRGIAHSERTGGEARAHGQRLSGLQMWVALPKDHEDAAPFFASHEASDLPVLADRLHSVRVVVGAAYGVSSPVTSGWDTLYLDVALEPTARLPVDADAEERAIYIASGVIEIAGDRFEAGQLLILRPGDPITLTALTAARLVVVGGATMDGPRHIWWNFVASSKDRIEAAKADWKAGRFAAVPGENEFIPLPE